MWKVITWEGSENLDFPLLLSQLHQQGVGLEVAYLALVPAHWYGMQSRKAAVQLTTPQHQPPNSQLLFMLSHKAFWSTFLYVYIKTKWKREQYEAICVYKIIASKEIRQNVHSVQGVIFHMAWIFLFCFCFFFSSRFFYESLVPLEQRGKRVKKKARCTREKCLLSNFWHDIKWISQEKIIIVWMLEQGFKGKISLKITFIEIVLTEIVSVTHQANCSTLKKSNTNDLYYSD